jgi:hypothetical protein
MKLEFPRQIFEKSSNIKFHENPLETELFHADEQTDMTKLTVPFRNFANATNNISRFFLFHCNNTSQCKIPTEMYIKNTIPCTVSIDEYCLVCKYFR